MKTGNKELTSDMKQNRRYKRVGGYKEKEYFIESKLFQRCKL